MAAFVAIGLGRAAQAQDLDQLFPNGVPGYDDGRGVTVQTRQRPEYDDPGTLLGATTVRPQVAEAIGYNDNVYGQKKGPGSGFAQTEGSVLAADEGSRGTVNATVSVVDMRYFSQPVLSQTNGTATLGGFYNFGEDRASAAYTFIDLHENPGDLTAAGFDRPINIIANRVLANYQFTFNRLTITPEVQFTTYRFGNSSLRGKPVDESASNRDDIQGTVTARYELAPQEDLVLVTRALSTQYIEKHPGISVPDSNTYSVLAGIDFTPSSLWSYRALAGYQYRAYTSTAVSNHTTPILEGSVIYSPTGLTTFTGTVTRVIEDSNATDTYGYVYTTAKLQVDHELYRNVLLNASVGYQRADLLQSTTTDNIYEATGGVTWLLSRYARINASYDYISSNSPTTGSYTRNLALLRLELGRYDDY